MKSAPSRRYVLITPCRDEADYIQRTIDSIAAQTVQPTKWIVVDDGSTDRTPEILSQAKKQLPYLQVVRVEDRGVRAVGPGVIEAFYRGLALVDLDDYDYVCKFDCDLELPDRYFETIIERMEADARIGTCSGKPYFYGRRNELISEACGDEMSVGMIKFYRVNCFRQIGGFVRQVMWDGIDCHRCRQLGWLACSWDDPEIRFIHLRPMGSSHKSVFLGRMRHGFGQYFMGTGFVYMTASALFRMTRPPLLTGGLSMWWGYVKAMMRGAARFSDREFRRFLRTYQRNCLFMGKKRATARLDAQTEFRWNPNRTPALWNVGPSPASETHRRIERANTPDLPKVSVLIINWNRLHDVLTTLHDLEQLDYPNVEVIVVDNGSTDGSREQLTKLSSVRLVALDRNYGPSRARNDGIRAAEGKYILLLDSDASVDPTGLRALVEHMERDPMIGVAGGRILNAYTGRIDQWIYAEKYATHGDREFKTYSFSAAGALLRAEAIEKAGQFWNELFMYNEEVDFSIRIIRAGYRIIYYPGLCIFHRCSYAGRPATRNYWYHQIRNWIWIFYRHYPRLSCYWKISMYSLVYIVKSIVNFRLLSCVSGIVAGLRGTRFIAEYEPKLTADQVLMLNTLNRRWWIRLGR